MTFDVSQYELEDTAVLTVQNASEDDDLIGADGTNPVKIVLYSPGSKQGVRALHKAGHQATARVRKVFRGKVDKTDAEAADQEEVEKLASFTKEIINFPISAEELYANPKLGYIKRQVSRFLDNDANFSKPSTKTSASSSDKAPG